MNERGAAGSRHTDEVISGVAVRLPSGKVIRGGPGQIHADLIPDVDLDEHPEAVVRLFVTSRNRVIDAREAQVIAKARGQTNRPQTQELHTSSLREPREGGVSGLSMLGLAGGAAGAGLTAEALRRNRQR